MADDESAGVVAAHKAEAAGGYGGKFILAVHACSGAAAVVIDKDRHRLYLSRPESKAPSQLNEAQLGMKDMTLADPPERGPASQRWGASPSASAIVQINRVEPEAQNMRMSMQMMHNLPSSPKTTSR